MIQCRVCHGNTMNETGICQNCKNWRPQYGEQSKPATLGIPYTCVESGTISRIIINPQAQFKGEGIQLYGLLRDLEISDILVGQRSMWISSGSIPAAWFGQHARGMAFDTTMPGQQITISVCNRGIKPRHMRGVIYGTTTFRF